MPEVVRWYGLHVLKKRGSQKFNTDAENLLDVDDFIMYWLRSLPIALVAPELKSLVQLSTLDGHFIRLSNNKIIFFDVSAASLNYPDPRSRIAWLLDIKPEWKLDEIWLLIKDVVPGNVKKESYIMKFARKRKVGKFIMISKR